MSSATASRFPASAARATTLVLLSAVSFGGISVLTVFASREGMAVLNLVFWRFLFATIVLLAVAFTDVRAHWRAGMKLFVAGGLLQAVCTYMSLSSLRFIPASVVAFLFFTYPAWLALTSAARGSDPLTPKRAVILLIAMAGVALMIGIPGVGTSAQLNVVGVALALGSALLYSTYLPIVDHLQRGIPQIPAAFFIICGALLSFFVAGVVLSRPWTGDLALSALALPSTPRAWSYVLLLAFVSTVIAFLALMAGLRTLGPTRTSIIATTEPFFTTILVVVFLAERLQWTTLVGGACIAAAVVAIALERQEVVEAVN